MRRRQFSNRLGLTPVGIVGEDMFAPPGPSSSQEAAARAEQYPSSSSNNDSNNNNNNNTDFRILPNSSDDEILNQIQALMTLTLQNQAAIHKIVTALERQGVITSPLENTAENESSSKGKGRLTTIDTNPFD